MNCDQFELRMQQLLDDRIDVGSDAPLREHADQCPDCARQLTTWISIDSVLSRSVDADSVVIGRRKKNAHTAQRPVRVTLLATAALLLVAVTIGRPTNSTPRVPLADVAMNRLVTDDTNAGEPGTIPAGLPAGADTPLRGTASSEQSASEDPLKLAAVWTPTQWWMSVAEDDWVTETMPAVDSMREGVAPIGRSMRRAMTILMTKARPTMGITPDPASELNSNGADGQTSLNRQWREKRGGLIAGLA